MRRLILLVTALSLLAGSCAPTVEQIRAVDHLRQATCEVVRVFRLAPTDTVLCVTEDELRQALTHVLAQRRRAEQAPGQGTPPGTPGTPLPLPPGRTLGQMVPVGRSADE